MAKANLTPAEKLGNIDRELRHVLSQVTALYRALAESPEPMGPKEKTLKELLEHRDRLCADLGRAGMAVIASGGAVTTGQPPAQIAADAPPPPITAEELLEQARRGMATSWTGSQTGQARHEILTETLSAIGGPKPLSKPDDYVAAVQRLGRAIAKMDRWLELPRPIQKALMGLTSSIARQIQDGPPPLVAADPLNVVFSRMSAWSRENRPGFVPGLSRHNDPDYGSWLADASHWWAELQGEQQRTATTPEQALRRLGRIVNQGVEEAGELVAVVQQTVDTGLEQTDRRLVQALAPIRSLLAGSDDLKQLRYALDDAAEADDKALASVALQLSDDWPWFAHTDGVAVAVCGGDPRPNAIQQLEKTFRFGEVTWREAGVPNAEKLAEGIAKGDFGMLVVLRRYLSHRETTVVLPVAMATDLPICIIDTSYGVGQLRQAIENRWPELQPG